MISSFKVSCLLKGCTSKRIAPYQPYPLRQSLLGEGEGGGESYVSAVVVCTVHCTVLCSG